VFLAAGDEPVPTIGIAPMIDLRPVLGVEADEIADAERRNRASLVRIASPLRADMIFGKDNS
jgi:hypothetical protein